MRRALPVARVVLAVGLALISADARAQGNFYGKLSFTSEQMYDGNLFAAPGTVGVTFVPTRPRAPESDLFVRFGPDLEVGYVTPVSRVALRYGIAAERYLNLPGLNKNIARQEAGISVRYLTEPRIELTLDGSYLTTHTPTELLSTSIQTGQSQIGPSPIGSSQIALGRAQAVRAALEGSATYKWTPVTRLTADYTFTRDALSGGVTGAAHVARAVFEYRSAERSSYRVSYRFRRIGFVRAEAAGTPGVVDMIIGGFYGFSDTPPDMFHLISGGWTFKLTPLTTLQIDAGPEMSERTIYPNFSAAVREDLGRGRPVGPLFTERGYRPDITGSIRKTYERGELLLRFGTTQETSIGERGIFNARRIAATGTFRPTRRLTLSATPAFLRTTRDRSELDIYTADLQAVLAATRQLSLSVAGRVGRQHGTVVDPFAVIPTKGISFKVTVTTIRNAPLESSGPPAPEGKSDQ